LLNLSPVDLSSHISDVRCICVATSLFEIALFPSSTVRPKESNDAHQSTMTDLRIRETNFPQTKPSAPSKSNSLAPAAIGVGGIQSNSRAKVTSRQAETEKPAGDTTTDKVTAAFIRRTLCSQNVLLGNGEKARNTPRPIEELLPPLTSSNDVDLQLYAIISVIVKEFIQTWYSKITPDHVFVNEVIQIIAHCTRALEQRLRKVDLEALLLDEIPELLEAHLSGTPSRAQHQQVENLITFHKVSVSQRNRRSLLTH